MVIASRSHKLLFFLFICLFLFLCLSYRFLWPYVYTFLKVRKYLVPSCKSEAIEWCLKEPVRHFLIVILLCSIRALWFDFCGGFQGVFLEKVSDERVNSSAFLVCICLAVGAFTGENFAQQLSKDQKQQWFSLELIQLILQLPFYLATLDGRGLCFIHYHVKPRGASHDHLRHLIWCDVWSWRAWRVKFVMIYVMSFHVILFLELPHPVKSFVIIQLCCTWYLAGFGTSAEMYYDTTLQEAFSRGLKCHSNDLSKSCKLVRLIAKYLHEDYNSVFYGKAQNLGRELCKAYDAALEKYDVLILPTIPKKAPVFPQENPPMEGQILAISLCQW